MLRLFITFAPLAAFAPLRLMAFAPIFSTLPRIRFKCRRGWGLSSGSCFSQSVPNALSEFIQKCMKYATSARSPASECLNNISNFS